MAFWIFWYAGIPLLRAWGKIGSLNDSAFPKCYIASILPCFGAGVTPELQELTASGRALYGVVPARLFRFLGTSNQPVQVIAERAVSAEGFFVKEPFDSTT